MRGFRPADRGHDDHRGVLGVLEMAHRGSHRGGGVEHVGLELCVQSSAVEWSRSPPVEPPAFRHHEIEPAERLGRLGDRRLETTGVGHVGNHGVRGGAEAAELPSAARARSSWPRAQMVT